MNNNLEHTLKTIAGTVAVCAVLAVLVSVVIQRLKPEQVVPASHESTVDRTAPQPMPTFTPEFVVPTRIPTITPTPVPTEFQTRMPTATATVMVPKANTNANIRGGPSTQYPIVGSVSTGDVINVVGMNHLFNAPHVWLKLGAGNWIRSDMVDDEKDRYDFFDAPPTPVSKPTIVPDQQVQAHTCNTHYTTQKDRENCWWRDSQGLPLIEETPALQPSTPVPTLQPTPQPTSPPAPNTAHLWIYMVYDGYFGWYDVFADTAFRVDPFDLSVFIDGREFCNVNALGKSERELSCDTLDWIPRNVEAEIDNGWGVAASTLSCRLHRTEGRHRTYACDFDT